MAFLRDLAPSSERKIPWQFQGPERNAAQREHVAAESSKDSPDFVIGAASDGDGGEVARTARSAQARVDVVWLQGAQVEDAGPVPVAQNQMHGERLEGALQRRVVGARDRGAGVRELV